MQLSTQVARWSLAVAGLLVTLLEATPVHAYRTLADVEGLGPAASIRWESEIRFAYGSDPPSGWTEGEFADVVRGAFTAWTEAGCATPPLRSLGRGSAGASSGDGTVSVVVVRRGWADMGLDPAQAAVTDLAIELAPDGSAGRIVDADIYLNADGFDWAGDLHERLRALRPVLVHEVGHVLGLAHNCELAAEPHCSTTTAATASTMYPGYLPEVQAAVREDDRAGLCAVYGERGMPCAAACDAGRVCRDGGCLPLECAATGCEPCTSDDACAEFHCTDGFCLRPRPAGAACSRPRECASGACEMSVCASSCGASGCPDGTYCSAGGACALVPPDFGAECASPTDCASSLCAHGMRSGSFCTVECSSSLGTCPASHRCQLVDGVSVCVPPSGGCSALPRAPATTAALGSSLAVLAILVLRRKR